MNIEKQSMKAIKVLLIPLFCPHVTLSNFLVQPFFKIRGHQLTPIPVTSKSDMIEIPVTIKLPNTHGSCAFSAQQTRHSFSQSTYYCMGIHSVEPYKNQVLS